MIMIKNIKLQFLFSMFLFFLLLVVTVSSNAESPLKYGIDPHDSLIFDGANLSSFDYAGYDKNCYIKVAHIVGTAKGTVITQKFISGCGNKIDSQYVAEYKTISVNDILDKSTDVITESDGILEFGIYIAGYSTEMAVFYQKVWPDSKITLPMIENLCFTYNQNIEPDPYEAVERIKVINGKVTYKSEKGVKPIFGTQGKNASAKHTKTNYSHEVMIDGIDTIDVIRVYEGSVEVTYMRTDHSNEEAMLKKHEKLSEDMQAGKITAEEMEARLTELQNHGQNLIDLMTPVEVNEGSKCIISKITRIVEPLGAGDEDIAPVK